MLHRQLCVCLRLWGGPRKLRTYRKLGLAPPDQAARDSWMAERLAPFARLPRMKLQGSLTHLESLPSRIAPNFRAASHIAPDTQYPRVKPLPRRPAAATLCAADRP
ncbi:hypothetical protein P4H65_27515, partial [Paenibacillus chitinolyticus]|uniref:hypothetical protein n=1 Tax=Paenibacillus chitinolyticus TaxID=79263 RepID=UPI002DBF33E4